MMMRSHLKHFFSQWGELLVTTVGISGSVMVLSVLGVFQLAELAVLDQFFQRRPQEPTDSRVVVVAIEEADISEVGRWPIPDETLATLLERIRDQRPSFIGLDLFRDLPVQPGHDRLQQVFRTTPNLIGVEKRVGGIIAAPPSLEDSQVSFADLLLDADGRVRRSLLTIQDDTGSLRLSLAMKLAMSYLETKGITPEADPASPETIHLGQAPFRPLTTNSGAYVGADTGGYQILLNYRGTQKYFQTITLRQVLNHQVPPDLFRDRIVLIGSTAESLKDMFATPYTSRDKALMPGVVVHANNISQILSAALDGRPLLKTLPQTLEWGWTLLWSLLSAGG
jgi:CHASE2 domain-containing sensor protein